MGFEDHLNPEQIALRETGRLPPWFVELYNKPHTLDTDDLVNKALEWTPLARYLEQVDQSWMLGMHEVTDHNSEQLNQASAMLAELVVGRHTVNLGKTHPESVITRKYSIKMSIPPKAYKGNRDSDRPAITLDRTTRRLEITNTNYGNHEADVFFYIHDERYGVRPVFVDVVTGVPDRCYYKIFGREKRNKLGEGIGTGPKRKGINKALGYGIENGCYFVAVPVRPDTLDRIQTASAKENWLVNVLSYPLTPQQHVELFQEVIDNYRSLL